MRKLVALVAVLLLAVSLLMPLVATPLPVDPAHVLTSARSGHP